MHAVDKGVRLRRLSKRFHGYFFSRGLKLCHPGFSKECTEGLNARCNNQRRAALVSIPGSLNSQTQTLTSTPQVPFNGALRVFNSGYS